ncbi:hypothetical protein O6H91_10G066900 [Diphasiastrum complanatum]|nr:hypothetical protein O6H91_10G066900 [Diphasiastrum complanatum]KAJ7541603.1 hypothetical protein O6H91_10G066900 [Diphasiastrum complanatum]KAJ7541604.1 hypothetical protein O6H91_10G066900 [Diphasiastrum complanatum]
MHISMACDLVVIVNKEHSFVLSTRLMLRYSGLICKMLKILTHRQPIRGDLVRIKLNDFPGGPEIFDLAVKFCCGGSGDHLAATNIVRMRCAAEYLEMTEQYCKQNLIKETEEALGDMMFWDWQTILDIYKSCEAVLPLAEKTRIVQRCADSLAWRVHSSLPDQSSSASSSTGAAEPRFSTASSLSGSFAHSWWFGDISKLSIYLMERVVKALIASNADNKTLARFLLYYLHHSLPMLGYTSVASKRKNDSNEDILHTYTLNVQREVLESVVCLLSSLVARSAPYRSLFTLLRIAGVLDASKSCKSRIERMIGAQLDMATLDHLMITVHPTSCSSLYDVDLVLRFVQYFLQDQDSVPHMKPERMKMVRQHHATYFHSAVQSPLTKVGHLMDKYLAEIAPDVNLKPIKFQELAEALTDSARRTHDGLYRAVDIYLEAHASSITKEEACNISKVLDYKKLSFDASEHLAKNPRFPSQLALHVLLIQQLKLRATIAASIFNKSGVVRSGDDFLEKGFTVSNQLVRPLQPSCDIRQILQGARSDALFLEKGSTVSNQLVRPSQPSCTNIRQVLQENEVLKSDLHEMESKVVELERLCKSMRFHVSFTSLVC